ncbi:FKBP-type peptidyl-prolyl cis-trans isomerase [Rubritalea profundi]|uniref:FKBP-type peptidyl-prolyl cis-trans isomerase n=1 Tax=Rubritalea profundi TaxID=1658618 RepID=UPI001980A78B|nr:FKBP-type peptidyl-prolyl cis-trans isomerase [Rubritalea profundi]
MKRTQTKQMIVAGMGAMLACGTINLVNAANVETPVDVAAAPSGAEKTASGLASKVLKKGTGTEKPGARDEVTVHYSGWTLDGKLFDSSEERGQTTSFPLNQVIKGWTEGLQLMVVGEKRRFWIPAELAYGENPGGGRPGGMLCFDVELFDIKKSSRSSKAS